MVPLRPSLDCFMIKIETEYFTEAGLVVDISRKGATDWEPPVRVRMERKGYGDWVARIPEMKFRPRNAVEQFRWRFSVVERGKEVRSEQTGFYHRWVGRVQSEGECSLRCLWIEGRHTLGQVSFPRRDVGGGVWIVVNDFYLSTGRSLRLCGSTEETGQWNPLRALRGERIGVGNWYFSLHEPVDGVEYKFVIVSENDETEWEEGSNRTIDCRGMIEVAPRLKENALRLAGLVVPVFSLRSERSWGVGDFGDLELMIDFVARAGLRVLQLLPINDTTHTGSWADSYPYSVISVFALHPLYIDLNKLGRLEDTGLQHRLESEREELNDLSQLDYEGAYRVKMEFARCYFSENRRQLMQIPELKAFVRQNEAWLEAYVCFKVLQRSRKTSDTAKWGAQRTFCKGETMAQLRREGLGRELDFEIWMQYELYSELREAHRMAARVGVMLKGDIPIGVNRSSVETWQCPQYFNFDGQAGAPPDYFASEGQNWGFPTYRWDEILNDGGDWWKRRMRLMSNYFDAYRLDHVLGFFRIWEIPYQYVYGTLGHFNPALPLSVGEIERRGFRLDAPDCWRGAKGMDAYTRAWFTEDELTSIFGKATAASVSIRFFERIRGTRLWHLRRQYLSQRQIMSETMPGKVRDGLMKAVCNVLFLKDGRKQDAYYPNIVGPKTMAFARLDEARRRSYLALHDDFFYHRHDTFWVGGAVEKLKLLTESTPMLACAEDLGMIPVTMRMVLDKLQILSLEVETMPKQGGGRFADVPRNPECSVDTITTHDMPPLRLWWENYRIEAQAYYSQVLGMEGPAPVEATTEICEKVIERHLCSPSRLCIIALQDWLGMDDSLRRADVKEEQINKPAVSHRYWRYRMHLPIERLLDAESYIERVLSLVKKARR